MPCLVEIAEVKIETTYKIKIKLLFVNIEFIKVINEIIIINML